MPERKPSSGQVVVLEVEIPVIHTADLDSLREFKDEVLESESEFLRRAIGEPSVVRLRCEIAGEKDGEVVEGWGRVLSARLVPGSVDEDELARHGDSLMRDEGTGCELCERRGDG